MNFTQAEVRASPLSHPTDTNLTSASWSIDVTGSQLLWILPQLRVRPPEGSCRWILEAERAQEDGPEAPQRLVTG